MDNNAEGRQRARRTPLVLPLLGEDLEVLRTDVDGVGSLMEGMTIVPSVRLVLSLPSVTTPTSTALVTGGGVPSFPTRSGGPRGDTSVLLAQFARTGLAWGDGAGVIGGMSGGGQSICSY
jgi:hypothetical protein